MFINYSAFTIILRNFINKVLNLGQNNDYKKYRDISNESKRKIIRLVLKITTFEQSQPIDTYPIEHEEVMKLLLSY